ncbi:MAG: hypothetical protein ABIO76_06890 [Ginsengibacter sp.]
MKIRIKGSSIRVRLSKSETELFAVKGYLEERTDFASSTFTYCVRSTEEKNLGADFIDGNITIYIPQHLLKQWAETNLISLDYNMPIDNNKHLYILLEKDFKCIDAVVNEDQSDYFENPAKSC